MVSSNAVWCFPKRSKACPKFCPFPYKNCVDSAFRIHEVLSIQTMAGDVEVLAVCPHLIPQDETKTFFDGYVTVCVS